MLGVMAQQPSQRNRQINGYGSHSIRDSNTVDVMSITSVLNQPSTQHDLPRRQESSHRDLLNPPSGPFSPIPALDTQSYPLSKMRNGPLAVTGLEGPSP